MRGIFLRKVCGGGSVNYFNLKISGVSLHHGGPQKI
jgi:hypothetical protein